MIFLYRYKLYHDCLL